MNLIIELKNGTSGDDQSVFNPSVCADVLNGAIRGPQTARAR